MKTGHSPVEPGHVRVYNDHTGRFYEDISEEELRLGKEDPLMILMNDAIREEIDREILEKVIKQKN